jgi:biopolymer transport protein TolR
MLRKLHKSGRLFSDFNTLQFAGVMAMVMFVILLAFMTDTAPYHSGVSVDLPKVSHSISMQGALREDAMLVTVMRDGRIYFDNEQIFSDSLAKKINDHLKDRRVERKVYIKADMRARYGAVKSVLDEVHSAGVLRIGILVYQRSIPGSPF